MTEVQNNSVDFVLTSPPYATLDVFSREGDKGAEYDLSRYHSFKSFFTEISKVWSECERVLRPGGVLICEFEDYPVGSRYFGYPREVCLCGPMVRSIEKSGLYLISRWIVKKFESGTALKKFQYTMYDNLKQCTPRAVSNWAYAFAFAKTEYKPKPRRLDFKREEWAEWSDGVWNINFQGSGLDISGGATYPVEFAKRCIRIYTNPGDVVLDPFGGTGTTMLAAFEIGRSCVLYEVLERMLPIIKAKVHFGQQDMFEQVHWEIVNRYTEAEP
jgi:DNA modification methylase